MASDDTRPVLELAELHGFIKYNLVDLEIRIAVDVRTTVVSQQILPPVPIYLVPV